MTDPLPARPTPILVMGVCGTGKTTVAQRVAQGMGGYFLDADDFHPRENVERMAAGQPLNDEMRHDWLEHVAAGVIRAQAECEGPVTLACSALKRRYRDRLRHGIGALHLAYLRGNRALIAERMSGRIDHYMPIELLDSQLADLEPPGPEETPLICDIVQPPEVLAAQIQAAWGSTPQD
ncbi:gluconokinase [Thioclava sp. BHET1]|uniref:Gluconokinase n=1 Tax=Thioclava dalianensis TaxID=1185766 RepID=A0A074TNK0_9RHOB|nr:gluconokinase [Thioclava dalianensis]KEP70588.1 gluconate kinase [Thioclava dalianensis]TMV90614.1 gluconokinase [Thioclava sp. BHET1]SFN07113.1 gluconokinase [Thioclava dalianensis]